MRYWVDLYTSQKDAIEYYLISPPFLQLLPLPRS